jgi:hypothetical protein
VKCFRKSDFCLSVQNNGNHGNSLLISYYEARKAGSLGNDFNTSGRNASTTVFNLRSSDQPPISRGNRSVWSPQTNTNISDMNVAFESSADMSSNTWAAKADKLNINTQNKSVSDEKTAYFR